MTSPRRTPLVIITRDRADYLARCVESLTRGSMLDRLDVHIVDHGSTWPRMCDLLETWAETGAWSVHRRGDCPPRSLWDWPGLVEIVGETQPYLVTDPDVVLDDACPDDWLCRLSDQLRPEVVKVGLGLRIDDLPATAQNADVTAWESAFWREPAPSGRAWRAPVDTTLALYPPLSTQPGFALGPAVRLDAPYLLRHLPWYGELDVEEAQYYRGHALPGTSCWSARNGGF